MIDLSAQRPTPSGYLTPNGVEVPLTTDSDLITRAVEAIEIQASYSNTGIIYLGFENMNLTTGEGVIRELGPGDSYPLVGANRGRKYPVGKYRVINDGLSATDKVIANFFNNL